MTIKMGTLANNTILGTNGSDSLYGLAGNDTLRGSTGADLLSGGAGNDTLEGGLGADALNGGAGRDIFLYSQYSHANNDSITDFSVGDTLDFSKIAKHKFIGNQLFNGVAGEIRYDYQPHYNRGAIPFSTVVDKTNVEIDSDGDGEADVFMQINGRINFTESKANSGKLVFAEGLQKVGTNADDQMSGGSGDDILSGLNGNDTLLGGEGNDRLLGGSGIDTLDGGLGIDTLTGGIGNDIFRFSNIGSSSYETISDLSGKDQVLITGGYVNYIGDKQFSGNAGEYRFCQGFDKFDQSRLEFDMDGDLQVDSAILLGATFKFMLEETKVGSNNLLIAANKTVTGTSGINALVGGAGNDTLSGLAGNDQLSGGMGSDKLLGGLGADDIKGESGNDTIEGGAGADVVTGGQGADKMTGGAGADTFRFVSIKDMQSPGKAASTFVSNDTITDFAKGDKIDLVGIDANINIAKDQAFTFVNSKDFSGLAGELRYDDINNLLEGDINGDTQTDFYVVVNGINTLTATDFIL